MSNFLTTIKEQIKDLVGPQEYRRLKESQELGIALDEYRERIAPLKSRAASLAREESIRLGLSDEQMVQQMNLAARTAQEIEMAEVMIELEHTYGPTIESPMEISFAHNSSVLDTPAS
ncbi:MAG: hypothetical protein O2971_13220 [Proteobacteria bacterium]|nr:hypothetical protein [Pseudomonadota bacterium]